MRYLQQGTNVILHPRDGREEEALSKYRDGKVKVIIRGILVSVRKAGPKSRQTTLPESLSAMSRVVIKPDKTNEDAQEM
jgi:hypothetical protein